MRKIVLIGTAALLSFGATSAFAYGGGNLAPEASPYALLAPQSLLTEGRSVYTGGAGYTATYGAQPFFDAPAPTTTPRERIRHHHHRDR